MFFLAILLILKKNTNSGKPVSYTHLDVYKRQADYAALSGVWKNEDAQADETLTLSADGLFVYHTGEGNDVQGYLEYVDEYNDGNGRYDMYNRMGMWLEGFYLDSADTLHMGNDGAAVFTRAEEDQAEENSEGQTENEDSVDLPVVAHDEHVHVVFVHVGDLLVPALLRDDEVDIADRLEHPLAPLMFLTHTHRPARPAT